MKKLAFMLIAAGLVAGNANAATMIDGNVKTFDFSAPQSIYELGSFGGLTTFQLNDTYKDGKTLNVELFYDNQAGAGYSLGGAVSGFPLSFTDVEFPLTQPLFQLSLAAGEYVLRLTTTNPNGATTGGVDISAVPLPGAALLFGSALFGAGALRRKKQQEEAEAVAA